MTGHLVSRTLRLRSRNQRNKAAEFAQADPRSAVFLVDHLQLLRISWANRNDHPSAFRQLFDQRMRHLRCRSRNDDRIVGSTLGKPMTSIDTNNSYVGVPHAAEQLSGRIR